MNSIVSTFPVGCRRFLVGLAVLALVAVVFAPRAEATTVAYQTDAQLVALSDRVVHGRVVDVHTELGADGRTIYTVAQLAVLEDLTGFTDATIEVREMGGVLDGTRLWIPGSTEYNVGDQLLLCLKQVNGKWQSVAKAFSAFAVQGATLTRNLAEVNVLGGPAQETETRSLGSFRQIVQSVKGKASFTPVQSPDTASTGTPVMAPFTLLGPMRWNQADTNQAVAWYRNPSASAPTTADINASITTAMQAWTQPTDASITLQYLGTQGIGTQSPYCADAVPNAGLITFEDPTNEITAPTLAVGGACSDSTSTVVNGTSFNGITRAFVVFNNAAEIPSSIQQPLNFNRVLTHEVGHGIGMGHTQPTIANAQSNLMYASCCYSTQPTPPAIGDDDHAGVVFIYPVSTTTPPGGGGGGGTTGDSDGDGLPDAWEIQYGLDPHDATGDNGANGDPDHDGFTNLQEYQMHTHPRGFVKRYLAEGVVNSFFSTQIALLNPGTTQALTLLRLQTQSGTEVPYYIVVPAQTRVTVNSATFASLLSGSFATLVESDQTVVVDRTVTWGGGYGSSAETAVESPSNTWYLAEGATGGPFDVFYLLQNPNTTDVTADITYLLPGGVTPLVKRYTVPARGRLTVWIDDEDFPVGASTQKLLANTDVSGKVDVKGCPTVSTDPSVIPTCPIIVERSMYLSTPSQPFAAGHDAAGVTAPNADWFLAEGATGAFFDMYILIENPNPAPATVHVSYLLTSGSPLTKDYVIAANSRYTIFVDEEELPAGSGQKPLQNVVLSTELQTDPSTPIVVERAMWWPSGNWYEAHDVAGSIETGTKWALAEGEQGGAFNTHTYVLIANLGDQNATVSVKAVMEDGTVLPLPSLTIPATSRSTVEIADAPPLFSGVNGRRFGVIVESLGTTPQPIVIERSMYSDYQGQFWAAGTAALGNCLEGCKTKTQ